MFWHLSPQQSFPRSLPELLAAFAALLVRRQPEDVPELHDTYTIHLAVHAEFRMLQQLGYGLTTLTPVAWVDIYRRRYTLRQQLHKDPFNRLQQADRADSLAFLTNQLCRNPLLGRPIQCHLHGQSNRHGCLVCFCSLVVATLQFHPALVP